jgi:uncharacterized protein
VPIFAYDVESQKVCAKCIRYNGEQGTTSPEIQMNVLTSPWVGPVALLVTSNIFMTFAWYGHLKFKASPLYLAIVASWAIALLEYCLAVPANRWGSEVYSVAQLKTMQEVITLAVFAVFSIFYLGEPLGWNHAAGFALIAAGAALIFHTGG